MCTINNTTYMFEITFYNLTLMFAQGQHAEWKNCIPKQFYLKWLKDYHNDLDEKKKNIKWQIL